MFDLTKSPVRENINSLAKDQLSVFEDDGLLEESEENYRKLQVRTILKDVENMLDTMEESRDQAVRIAVMGEVKAGKSTFVNVCVGKEVAYTDILEATAVVSEIVFAKETYVHVLDQNGNIVKNFTPEELLAWTEEQIDAEADFSIYGKIEIGTDCDFLKNIIFVDTPGLLSVTAQNHDVTNRYVAQADYILWVINSRNLGSKAVNDYIDKISLSGKPMIGIINKVDSQGEQEEIAGYIEKEYGNIFEEIFYVSSANAWEAQVNGDADWAENTGFSEVTECILDMGEDKEQSTDRTQYYQLQREREVHLKMKERIHRRKEFYDNELKQFAALNNGIKKTIRMELEDWIHKELYMDEKTELMNAKGQAFQELIDRYGDAAYLTTVIEHKYQEMTQFIHNKWEVVEKRLAVKASEVLVDFRYDKSLAYGLQEDQDGQKEFSQEDAKRWMKRGTAAGLVFAGYAAWLGPAAEIVTFAGALPGAVPLAVGVGVIGYLTDKNKAHAIMETAGKKQKHIEDLYQAVVKTVEEKEKAGLVKSLFSCTDNYYNERCSMYKEKTAMFHFDYTEPYYGTFCRRLDAYLDSLDREIVRLGYQEIPSPPSMKEIE